MYEAPFSFARLTAGLAVLMMAEAAFLQTPNILDQLSKFPFELEPILLLKTHGMK